jgi:hypothetical protein
MVKVNKPDDKKDWLLIGEAQDILSCDGNDIIKMISDGELRTAKSPRGWYLLIDPKSVSEIVQKRGIKITNRPIRNSFPRVGPPRARRRPIPPPLPPNNPRLDLKPKILKLKLYPNGFKANDVARAMNLSPKTIIAWIEGYKVDAKFIYEEYYINVKSLESFLQRAGDGEKIEIREN